jgi:hypothetical protein
MERLIGSRYTVLTDYLGEESAFGLHIKLFYYFRLILIMKPALQKRKYAKSHNTYRQNKFYHPDRSTFP